MALTAAFLFCGLAVAGAQAPAGVATIECIVPKDGVSTVLEIDYEAKSVLMWSRFGTVTNGPFGPFRVAITPQTIVWKMKDSRGKGEGISTNTIDRKRRTLSVEVNHGADEAPFRRLNTPCKDIANAPDAY